MKIKPFSPEWVKVRGYRYAYAATIEVTVLPNGARTITLTVIPDDELTVVHESSNTQFIVIVTKEEIT